MVAATGKVVIVTGGAYGIGRAIVRYFAARGFGVLIADINVDRGQDLQKQFETQGQRVVFAPTDVRDDAAVQGMIARAVEEWGRLDVLCNNAGVECYRISEEYTTADWDTIVHTNLRGTFLCTKYALPHLIKVKGSV